MCNSVLIIHDGILRTIDVHHMNVLTCIYICAIIIKGWFVISLIQLSWELLYLAHTLIAILSAITLPVRLFCLSWHKSMSMSMSIKANWLHVKPLTTIWQSFMLDHRLYPILISLFSGSGDIPNYPKGSGIYVYCIHLWAILNQSWNNANQYLSCNYWNLRISICISPKFVPKGPVHNKSTLVQVMAWRRTGDKPIPEPMLIQFTVAHMRH